MASSTQELKVNITANSDGLAQATAAASRQLDELKKDVDALDAEKADIAVDVNADGVNRDIENINKKVDKLDGETVEIPAKLQLDRINRDMANLNRVLDGIERRKADPDVGLDLVRLRRDEAKVRAELTRLSQQKVEIEASLDTSAIAGAAGGGAAGVGGAGLAGLIARLGPAKALIGGVVASIGAAGWQLVQLSADAETARLQLDTLTGSVEAGGRAFDDLNEFAKNTPFEFDEITTAARSLLAAGVDAGDLPETLTAIGDAASAVGQPLADIAVIYGQMVGKARVSNEELLQLQERGIDAYGILAERIGVTKAEVEQLASENKLGLDAVLALGDGMEETYGGSMQRQADSLNGKLSTMFDTVKQLGKGFGDILAPAVEAAVDVVTDLAGVLTQALDLRNKLQANANADDASWLDQAFGWLTKSGPETISWFGEQLEGVKNTFTTGQWEGKGADKATKNAAKNTKDAADNADDLKVNTEDAATAAEDYARELENVRRNLSDAADAFAELGGDVRLKVSYVLKADELRDKIRELTHGADAVELPANITLKNLGKLSEGQQELITTISSLAEEGLAEGARRAKLNPAFDEAAWFANIRAAAARQLIAVGVDPSKVESVLTSILGLPRTVPADVQLNLDNAQVALDAFSQTAQVPITPFISPEAQAAAAGANWLGGILAPKTAPILPTPVPAQVAAADSTLDNVAQPGGANRLSWVTPRVDLFAASVARQVLEQVAMPNGVARTAWIRPQIDPFSLGNARSILAELTATETKTIKIHFEENPTGETLTATNTRHGLALSPPTTFKVTATTPTPATPASRPMQVYPIVRVYVAGEEVRATVASEVASQGQAAARSIARGRRTG